jgi:hypothetical protein
VILDTEGMIRVHFGSREGEFLSPDPPGTHHLITLRRILLFIGLHQTHRGSKESFQDHGPIKGSA